MAPTPLTLAETASVFGEMLTFKKLLAKSTTKQRKAMLAAKVEDMINTVVRQVAFYTVRAQVSTSERRRTGRLTADVLNALWLECSDESLGEAIELKPGYETVLGLHSALRALAVLCLRLCLRRLPGQFAVRGLRARDGWLRRTLSGDARGRRHQASLPSSWLRSGWMPATPPSGRAASA
jgi:hypothetical protein